jgi:HipA-like C-terminal domain
VTEKFRIFEVPQTAYEEEESLGTKEKFWFSHPELGRCLYKKNRSNIAGEDWSEKIAAELCSLLGLPHAQYELAIYNGEYGVISPSFLPENGDLVHGNQILADVHLDYPKNSQDLSQHTVNSIFDAFDGLESKYSDIFQPLRWDPLSSIQKVHHIFVGYLLLDAWIGNSDRHHENWGFVALENKLYLAPTYDHASSLGRNESDEKREKRLRTKDKGYSVEAYADRCLSYFYSHADNKQRIKTFEAFCLAAKRYPEAASTWIEHLNQISSDDILDVLQRIPPNRISPVAIEFAQAMLIHNQKKLTEYSD